MVDLTINNIPADKVPIVIEWLESPNWFPNLVSLHPAISAQAAWWQEFANVLLETLKAPPVQNDEKEESD
jgi:hypothetical protein